MVRDAKLAVLVRGDVIVCGEREKFDEVLGEREILEHFRALFIFAGRVSLVAQHLANLREFLRYEFAE